MILILHGLPSDFADVFSFLENIIDAAVFISLRFWKRLGLVIVVFIRLLARSNLWPCGSWHVSLCFLPFDIDNTMLHDP